MAIARALPGFNDLGRSVTPTFILMDHFLYWFSTFREKLKKIYRLEVRIFGKMHHQIPFLLALRACVGRFQMLLRGLNFVKTSVTFGFIYATHPAHFYKIWLKSFASVDSPSMFLTINPCRPCSIIWDNSISETKTLTPNCFCISGTSNSLSGYSKNFKKFYRLGKFSRERP